MNPEIFKAYDVRGVYPTELDEQIFRQIGRAFVAFLKARRIGVGRDMRMSSPTLSAAFIEGARLQTVIQEAVPYFPVDTTSQELFWLYQIRENQQAIDKGGTGIPSPGLVFVSGHVPYRADAHFDVAKWDYSNYYNNYL